MNVEVMCTTNDITDDLYYYQKAKEKKD